MLIRFSVENWMSFRDPVSLSMVATREHQHRERVPKTGGRGIGVLPTAAIYGGNASGKTNLFKALNFAKSFVVTGTQPESLIPVEPFMLDDRTVEEPSRFEFHIYANGTIYGFDFSVTRKGVVNERLAKVQGKTEKVLYHRKDGKPNFHSALKNAQFLQFAFQGTRPNQLFLTNSVSQQVQVDEFKDVWGWFRESLVLVAPDSRFTPFSLFFGEKHPMFEAMGEMLYGLDTGITRLGTEEVALENIGLPVELRNKVRAQVKDDTAVMLTSNDPWLDSFAFAMKDGEPVGKKLCTYHRASNGKEVPFSLKYESDGSKRALNLLPAFIDLSEKGSGKVYAIDEIDRSLHTILTRRLLEAFLGDCSAETRSQLLMTTHDVLLMDQDLLRRDEMWVTERDEFGVSSLYSFSDFKDVRYDKDVRKSYLSGRLGGVPRILMAGSLSRPCL